MEKRSTRDSQVVLVLCAVEWWDFFFFLRILDFK